MTSYKKGYQFEREVFRLFQSAGYYVIRSAGSHGLFDLVAVKDGLVFGIQCKYNNHLKSHEKTAMINAYYTFGIIPVYIYRMKRKPIQIVCLLNGKVITDKEVIKLPEICRDKALNRIIKLNGHD